jgi:DNA-binding NarL/FixJ family response regulator
MNENGPITRIIIGDDHAIVRDGLVALLKDIPGAEVVGQAENGRELVQLARRHQPDVVIADVAMPELNGMEATRQILAEHPHVKVIALSMHSSRRMVEEMIQAGAVGYVLKSSAFQELASALASIKAGQAYVSPSIAALVLERIANPDVEGPSAASVLSPREREVLQLLTEGKKARDIADVLGVSLSTVETHRRNIMEKLDIRSLPELTKFAIREGITTAE